MNDKLNAQIGQEETTIFNIFNNRNPGKTFIRWQDNRVEATDCALVIRADAQILPMPAKCVEGITYPTIVLNAKFTIDNDNLLYHINLDEEFNHWGILIENEKIVKISERQFPDLESRLVSLPPGEKINSIEALGFYSAIRFEGENDYMFVKPSYFYDLLKIGFFPREIITNAPQGAMAYFEHQNGKAWVMGLLKEAVEKDKANEDMPIPAFVIHEMVRSTPKLNGDYSRSNSNYRCNGGYL